MPSLLRIRHANEQRIRIDDLRKGRPWWARVLVPQVSAASSLQKLIYHRDTQLRLDAPPYLLNEDTNKPFIGLERLLDGRDTATLPTGDGHLCEHLFVTPLRSIIQ